MEKYINYIILYHEGNRVEIDFINNQLKKHLIDNEENQTEIETILDYLYSNKPNISKVGYKTILEKTLKWHKKLQNISIKDEEKEGEDYDIVLDFKDGFKIVRLKSKASYEREGRLMSHCVSSYYGRDTKIYSLRDKNNLPHCTLEDGQQIKGKGNGSIDPKYVDYIVKFLEFTGMKVGENEMKNLGYYKLDKIDEGLSSDFLYNGYIYENKLNTIKDKEGKEYYGFGLLNVKNLFDFDKDLKIKWNFNIQNIKKYFIQSLSQLVGGDDSQLVGGYNSQLVGGDDSQLVGGYNSQLAGGDNCKLVGGYNSQLAGGDYSQLVGGDDSQLAGGDYSQLVGGYSSQLAGGDDSQLVGGNGSQLNGGDDSQLAGGDRSQLVGGDRSQLAGGYNNQLNGGDYSQLVGGNGSQLAGGYNCQLAGGYSSQLVGGNRSQLVGGDYSQLVLIGNNGIAVGGAGSKCKGKIGNLFAIGFLDEDYNYIDLKVLKIDGIKFKEDTFYKLENGEFVED